MCEALKPRNNSIGDHLLFLNLLPTFDDFAILTLLRSLLLMRDQLYFNKKRFISSIEPIQEALGIGDLRILFVFNSY